MLFAIEAGGAMAEVGLLPFARIALQVSKAVLPRYRSRFSKRQFTQPQLLAILCLMRYEDWTFREAEVRLAEHRELRQALGLASVPDFTTLYRFLKRLDDTTIDRAVARRCAACAVRDVEAAVGLGWRWTQRDWHKALSARSLCDACIITGRNRCRGGIG
jgi:Transposase domain (DUF772)